jgi:hypothetical protein
VILSNTYREDEEEPEFDQVISDNATLPNHDLYQALKPLSGSSIWRPWAAAKPQPIVNNHRGAFALYRIGDGWAAQHPRGNARRNASLSQPGNVAKDAVRAPPPTGPDG